MKTRINTLEFCSTFFMITLSPFLGMGLYNLLKVAKVDSTISIVLGYLLSFLILLLFFNINNYKPELNLKEKIDILFSKKISLIIRFSLCICFFIMASSLSYNLNSFIISQFLSETPIIFISIILGILIIYINSKGIEVILRVSNLLFFLCTILMLVAIFGNYNKLDINNLLPLLKDGINPPFKGSTYIILLNSIYIYILLIIPKKFINNKHINIMLIITNTIVYILFFIITSYTISLLGIDLSLLYHYPAYIVMKEVSIFGFIDKIENFIIIHWIFEIFINLSLITYFINKMTNIKPYIIVITNIFLYTLLFNNSTYFNYFVTTYIPIISIIIIIYMIAINIKIMIKKTELPVFKK